MWALTALHEIVQPTHWATIKLHQPLPLDEIRRFHAAVSKAIEYKNRPKASLVEVHPDLTITTTGQHIAIFAIPEIDEGFCLHYHVLVRATNINPSIFLNGVISKYNRKYCTKISMEFIEPPNSTEAVSIYSLKLGDHGILLFAPGSLSRYTFTAGKYFLNLGVKKLRLKRRNEWRLQELEKQVDTIVGEW